MGGAAIFEEGKDEWVLSCGTGIEGMSTCNDPMIKKWRRKKCRKGYPFCVWPYPLPQKNHKAQPACR